MVVNPDIFGALKSAVSRGHTIQSAMLTLQNAGYNTKEIQEAAQVFQSNPNYFPEPKPTPASALKKTSPSVTLNAKKQPAKSLLKSKLFITILLIFLVVLSGVLISTFLFKDKISEILSSFLG
jgi:hypothetical protein